MFIPTWFLYICYGLGAFFLLCAIFTFATGNLFLLGKLRESITNHKKAVSALTIYLAVSAILVSCIPVLAASLGKSTSYIFLAYLLYSIVFWYVFQAKWVGPIGDKK